MALNAIRLEGRKLAVVCSHPTTPTSGCPVRCGAMTGVAVTDERTAGDTTVDFGGVYDISTKGVNDAGNVAVAVGDELYYVDSDISAGLGFLSKKASGYFFGYALEAVNSGSTTTINVKLADAPGGVGDISKAAVPAIVKAKVVAGAAAGDVTVTGIAVADALVLVMRLDRDGTAANINITDLTSEFTISAANTINNAAGTSTSGDSLLVIYQDQT